jgi:Flp pilus assembly protein TadG
MEHLTTARKRRSGIAAIEMALLLPLLLTLVFGMIEYGSMFWRGQQVANAARNGARRGIMAGATASNVTTAVDQTMLASGMGTTNYTVVLTPANPASLAAGGSFTVKVSVPYVDIKLTGFPVPTPTNVIRTVTMAKEAP